MKSHNGQFLGGVGFNGKIRIIFAIGKMRENRGTSGGKRIMIMTWIQTFRALSYDEKNCKFLKRFKFTAHSIGRPLSPFINNEHFYLSIIAVAFLFVRLSAYQRVTNHHHHPPLKRMIMSCWCQNKMISRRERESLQWTIYILWICKYAKWRNSYNSGEITLQMDVNEDRISIQEIVDNTEFISYTHTLLVRCLKLVVSYVTYVVVVVAVIVGAHLYSSPSIIEWVDWLIGNRFESIWI